MYFLPFRGRSRQKAAWRELCRIIRHFGSGMIRPFAQNIWDLRPPVSVELSRSAAGILRANAEMVIDRTAASGEYCFKSGLGTMVHFATHPSPVVKRPARFHLRAGLGAKRGSRAEG